MYPRLPALIQLSSKHHVLQNRSSQTICALLFFTQLLLPKTLMPLTTPYLVSSTAHSQLDKTSSEEPPRRPPASSTSSRTSVVHCTLRMPIAFDRVGYSPTMSALDCSAHNTKDFPLLSLKHTVTVLENLSRYHRARAVEAPDGMVSLRESDSSATRLVMVVEVRVRVG
ncbi:uncharacterized protein EV420DRAFT_1523686 [Desarmillaria tabescens]|uniref:Uncharacterized protein n=1 Tax=Armillaria tabescens TaxID=1929756 RepID=A0AA39NCX2_ARMTA|nr:uncharacterized protein EV420DRAFT_1523686 [Desarmillaria tabescens]KAK0463281.1 hypothetical protein EV420DRAFT_1523686 [Desarmillaria tabescens]